MVNRLGFGAMRLTGSLVWDDSAEPKDREEGQRVPGRALELGVNREPDPRDASSVPGGLARSDERGSRTVRIGGWSPDWRPEHLRRACEASLKRLGLEQIDLYQFHITDPDVPYEESIGALAELRTEGRIRHVGLSNVILDQLGTARDIVPIASVQRRFNVAERNADDLVDVCERYGKAFLPYHPPTTGSLARAGGPLTRIASDPDATVGQVALAWLLCRSPVIIPIPGTSSVHHLEENVAAAGISLEETEIRTLDAA